MSYQGLQHSSHFLLVQTDEYDIVNVVNQYNVLYDVQMVQISSDWIWMGGGLVNIFLSKIANVYHCPFHTNADCFRPSSLIGIEKNIVTKSAVAYNTLEAMIVCFSKGNTTLLYNCSWSYCLIEFAVEYFHAPESVCFLQTPDWRIKYRVMTEAITPASFRSLRVELIFTITTSKSI